MCNPFLLHPSKSESFGALTTDASGRVSGVMQHSVAMYCPAERCIQQRPSRFVGAALSPVREHAAEHGRSGVILRGLAARTLAERPDLVTAGGVRRPMRATRCVGVKRTRGLIALGPATFVDGPTPRSTSAQLDRERTLGRDSGLRVRSVSTRATKRSSGLEPMLRRGVARTLSTPLLSRQSSRRLPASCARWGTSRSKALITAVAAD
jgi:hypothetical protein